MTTTDTIDEDEDVTHWDVTLLIKERALAVAQDMSDGVDRAFTIDQFLLLNGHEKEQVLQRCGTYKFSVSGIQREAPTHQIAPLNGEGRFIVNSLINAQT